MLVCYGVVPTMELQPCRDSSSGKRCSFTSVNNEPLAEMKLNSWIFFKRNYYVSFDNIPILEIGCNCIADSGKGITLISRK